MVRYEFRSKLLGRSIRLDVEDVEKSATGLYPILTQGAIQVAFDRIFNGLLSASKQDESVVVPHPLAIVDDIYLGLMSAGFSFDILGQVVRVKEIPETTRTFDGAGDALGKSKSEFALSHPGIVKAKLEVLLKDEKQKPKWLERPKGKTEWKNVRPGETTRALWAIHDARRSHR